MEMKIKSLVFKLEFDLKVVCPGLRNFEPFFRSAKRILWYILKNL